VTIEGDISAVKLRGTFSRMSSVVVGCLDDIERGAIVLAATLNRPASLERSLIEPTRDVDPSNSVTVADEDFVSVEVDLVVLVSDHSTLLEDVGCLAELDTTILEGSASVENATSLLTDGDSVAGHVLALVENPSNTTLVSAPVVLISADLRVPKPVLETPGECLFLLLALIMRFPSHITTSKETGACEKTTSDLEFVLALVVDIVPVLLLLLMRNIDLLIGVGLITAALLRLLIVLLLALLLAVTTLLLTIAALLLAAIPSLLAASVITILHATPQGWSNGRAPIALGAMRLDDFVVVSFVLYNVPLVVLSTWFPAVDHIDFVKSCECVVRKKVK
jgi:hypothetical protein